VRCTSCQQQRRRWAIAAHFKLTEHDLEQYMRDDAGEAMDDSSDAEEVQKEHASAVRRTNDARTSVTISALTSCCQFLMMCAGAVGVLRKSRALPQRRPVAH
jgi:hypothetical protein